MLRTIGGLHPLYFYLAASGKYCKLHLHVSLQFFWWIKLPFTLILFLLPIEKLKLVYFL